MGKIIVPSASTPTIVIRRLAHEMESTRRRLRDAWGDKYDSRVSTYRSLIRKEMAQRGCGAVDAARNFMGILKARKKLTSVTKAVVTAAALDVIDNADGRSGEKRDAVIIPGSEH